MPSHPNNFRFAGICLSLVVLGAVASQTMLDVATTAAFGLIIFAILQKRTSLTEVFRPVGVEWGFAAYFVVAILGFALNASGDAEIARSLTKFIWVLSVYIYIFVLERVRFHKEQIIWFFCLLFLIPNLYAITTYAMQFDFLTGENIKRVVGMVNSATYHAHANALIFVFFSAFTFFYFRSLPKSLRYLTIVCWLIFFLSIFLTFTRGIWASLFLSSVIMYGMISLRKALMFCAICFCLVAAAYFAWPTFRDRLTPSKSAASSSERINLIKVNAEMWREYPLLGIGYGENLRRNREYWDRPHWNMPAGYITSHAHNQYLNVLSTTGVIGLGCFLWFFTFFMRKNWQLFRAEKGNFSLRYVLLFACLWAQIEFALACLTDVTFEYAKIRSLYIVVWALVIVLERKRSLPGQSHAQTSS